MRLPLNITAVLFALAFSLATAAGAAADGVLTPPAASAGEAGSTPPYVANMAGARDENGYEAVVCGLCQARYGEPRHPPLPCGGVGRGWRSDLQMVGLHLEYHERCRNCGVAFTAVKMVSENGSPEGMEKLRAFVLSPEYREIRWNAPGQYLLAVSIEHATPLSPAGMADMYLRAAWDAGEDKLVVLDGGRSVKMNYPEYLDAALKSCQSWLAKHEYPRDARRATWVDLRVAYLTVEINRRLGDFAAAEAALPKCEELFRRVRSKDNDLWGYDREYLRPGELGEMIRLQGKFIAAGDASRHEFTDSQDGAPVGAGVMDSLPSSIEY